MGAYEEKVKKLLEPYKISASEYACHHCGKFPPGMLLIGSKGEDELSVEYQVLFEIFRQIRNQMRRPILITSGYRCLDHERKMFYDACMKEKTDKPAGKAFISAHLFGLALDLQAKSADDQMRMVEVARKVKPKPRIGWKTYRQNGVFIVHIDILQAVCPEFMENMVEEW